MKKTTMAVMTAMFLTGITTRSGVSADEPAAPVIDMPQGVLIIHGKGLIPDYADPTSRMLVSAVCEGFGRFVGESLNEAGVTTKLYENQSDVAAEIYVGAELGRQMRNALLQINVLHEYQGSHFEMILHAEFFPLLDYPDGTVWVSVENYEKRYVLLSTRMEEGEVDSIGEQAIDFANFLKAAGALDRSQAIFEKDSARNLLQLM